LLDAVQFGQALDPRRHASIGRPEAPLAEPAQQAPCLLDLSLRSAARLALGAALLQHRLVGQRVSHPTYPLQQLPGDVARIA
jgi:hypothetical protein